MTVVALIAVGLVAGTLGAMLGVGGGIVYVPALVALFSFAQHEAQGTSLAVIIPSTMIAAYVHARAGRVDWKTALLLGVGGILGGVAGARIALSLDAPVLKRMFAVFLVLAVLRMAGKTRRRSHPAADA
ncbi:MAG: sulfite exporter TauE/SafE family protein [Acidimicrobiia bacterium]|nr:sulfite exporter TauE/SafE family protein [Acidimicrobiia bacterium]